jgi:hypothetical protein
MNKLKYIAAIWIPGQQHPAASLDPGALMPSTFERIVNYDDPAPMYESENYSAIIIETPDGKKRTYANMPYRLTVESLQLITQEEFKNGQRFKVDVDESKKIY